MQGTRTAKGERRGIGLSSASVLNHKVSSPSAHRHAVEREGLLKRIFAPMPSRVVVFQGPAGHGKTSLMLQAQNGCRRRAMLTGWMSLDESDYDITRFLGHVQQMVAGLLVQAGVAKDAVIPARTADMSSRTNWLVEQLMQLMQLGGPVAVFLDDLHFVSSRMMLGFLSELLASTPPGIRWFLASRLVPEVELPRLVVGDAALVIRAEELRFSHEEFATFFASSGDAAPGAPEAAGQRQRLRYGHKDLRVPGQTDWQQ